MLDAMTQSIRHRLVWSSGGQLTENVDSRSIKSSAAVRQLVALEESRGLRISSEAFLFVTPLMYNFSMSAMSCSAVACGDLFLTSVFWRAAGLPYIYGSRSRAARSVKRYRLHKQMNSN
jgi:hypothetical protein